MATFQGGKPAGCLGEYADRFRLEMKKGKKKLVDKSFTIGCEDRDVVRARAKAYQREKSDELGLTKNKFRVVDGYGEVQLNCEGEQHLMQFSLEDLPIVEAHVWSTDSYHGYAVTGIKTGNGNQSKFTKFHRLICPSHWRQVDHRDRNRLNNRRENLREADSKLQASNQKKRSNNTSGHTGISFIPPRSGLPAGAWQFSHKAGSLEGGQPPVKRRRMWSVSVYGDDALKNALEMRDKVWKELGIESEK